MGKRRNTAKTGDKALYSKGRQSTTTDEVQDDDPMYTKIDRFHNEKDAEFLRLDAGETSDPDDGIVRQQSVMDLGVGGGDSSSEDDDDNDDDEEEELHSPQDDDDEEEGVVSSDSDDDESINQKMGDPRNWGRKKSDYYHGDTADLEIGQEEEDAFLEEEAAKEVQAARFKEMTEDDFVLSDDEEGRPSSEKKPSTEDSKEELFASRDLSKLSVKDKRKLLNKQHPELLPIVSYFSDIVKDLQGRTAVATKALMEGEEGTAQVSLIVVFLFLRTRDRLEYKSHM
jgi:U3 small nucleolar RNA-associated protein 3